MMPYIIILKVRKFHLSTTNRFGTAGKKPIGGHIVPPPPSLNRVNCLQDYKDNSLQGQRLNAMTEGQDAEVKAYMKVFYSS